MSTRDLTMPTPSAAPASDGEPPPNSPGSAMTHDPLSGAHEPSLTARTTRGFMWATIGTVGSKGVATIGQFVLAWLLTKDDFGWVAMALAIAAFPAVLQSGGLANILVLRQDRFRLYVNPCFWAGVGLAALAAALILLSAPIAALTLHSPTLAGLLAITALNTMIAGLGVVPYAMLQMQFRFKLLAALNATTTIVQMAAAIPLALMGCGAYSVLLATTVATTGTLAVAWGRTRPPIRRTPQWHRWKYVMGDASRVLATNFVWTITGQGDRLILGYMLGRAQVGVYFFAFSISMQLSMLLMSNLSSVLFPTFSRLSGDPVRQVRAFVRATRLVAVVGIPLTLLQAALAEPALRIMFQEKWLEAISPLQWFSIGMVGYIIGAAVTSLIMAQGRFETALRLALWYSALFLVAFPIGTALWGVNGAAATVCVLYLVFAVVGLYLGIRTGGGTMGDVARIYQLPLLASLAALAPGVIGARFVGPVIGGDWIRAGLICASLGVLYPLLLWLFGRHFVIELWKIGTGALLPRPAAQAGVARRRAFMRPRRGGPA